jgi:hypothetical protein
MASGLLGTILYRPVIDNFLSILSHKPSLANEINAFKRDLNAGLLEPILSQLKVMCCQAAN